MSTITICDLCKKPLFDGTQSEEYKFKKLQFCFDEIFWQRIDIHEECRKKLFEAIGKGDAKRNEEK